MEIYLRVIKEHYFDFEGRARREEFWMFFLFNLIVSIVLGVIDNIVGTGGILGGIYSLAVLLPTIAVGVRRLHDIDMTGWLYLLVLTGIGVFVLIFLWIKEGTNGANKFGPDPKGINNADANSPF